MKRPMSRKAVLGELELRKFISFMSLTREKYIHEHLHLEAFQCIIYDIHNNADNSKDIIILFIYYIGILCSRMTVSHESKLAPTFKKI